MAFSDVFNTTYQDIGLGDGNVLEIQTRYTAGGYSCFDGKKRTRGIIIAFHPVKVTPFGTERVLFNEHAYAVVIKELPRRSPKVCTQIAEKVAARITDFVELYKRNDRNGVLALAKQLGE